jgi:hypothetical protein
MPDFSPAAQAIVNAAVEAGGGYGRATPTLHARLAAALRAAADQMGCYQSKKFLYSIADAMKLQNIAAELETSTAENP